MVRTLERLIQVNSMGGRPKNEKTSGSSLLLDSSSLNIGVIAFHAGQVELIRRLLGRSAALAGVPISVGLPGQFAHGQCTVAVISLTQHPPAQRPVCSAGGGSLPGHDSGQCAVDSGRRS